MAKILSVYNRLQAGDYETGNVGKRRVSRLTQFVHATLQFICMQLFDSVYIPFQWDWSHSITLTGLVINHITQFRWAESLWVNDDVEQHVHGQTYLITSASIGQQLTESVGQ